MRYFFQGLTLLIFSTTVIACGSNTKYKATTAGFEIYKDQNKAAILYDSKGDDLDSIVAYLLSDDIFKVTGYQPKVHTDYKNVEGNVIVIGSLQSELMAAFINKKTINTPFINQSESYLYKTVENPSKKIKKAFIIAGTDARGTAFGVFDLSKKIGVSPWNWWADVPAKKSNKLVLNQPEFYSKEPSVSYRGIFINDEDWGLQPWAKYNYEPETGDIGPKTYAKVFELLLRLKANTIWPAMHPSTKAFFHYPGNRKMAELYHIALGSSHAEPMLRNNVDEWDEHKNGRFNYKTNKENVFKYWEDRVKEAKDIDGVYTIGMRGVHDSGMEGVKSKDEAVAVLTNVITDQRAMLKKHINPDVTKVPQAFTVYKEVLDLYKNGLEVPEDITLVWTDDNYGYIRSLSNEEEQKRVGGGGVYYHASYWGRPHDYLWLSSTNPYLIHEEMMKAYELNNKEIWILNVGDIKPAEYNMQLFMDMAYDAESFKNPLAVKKHQESFFNENFNEELGTEMADIKQKYYQLAFERKPEFMGWSQTEKTTPIYKTDYNALSNGDEIQQRIDAYISLEKRVDLVEEKLPEEMKSAFFQLVAYPVKGAVNMNKKFMYKDKALTYAVQSRKSAYQYKKMANQSYQNIVVLTKKYNTISNGKWNGMMDMKPRRLPVYDNPEIDLSTINDKALVGISVEDTLTVKGVDYLPTFYANDKATYFVDVFLKNANHADWSINQLPKWLRASQKTGVLNDQKTEDRILFSINWGAWKQAGSPKNGEIKIEVGELSKNIKLLVSDSYQNISSSGIVEKNNLALVYAENFVANNSSSDQSWKVSKGLGHSQAVVQVSLLEKTSNSKLENGAVLTYEFFTETITDDATLQLVAIPTHPLTTDGKVRIGVQWNDEPVKIVDFKTYGRSSEWKQNVLRNKARKNLNVSLKKKGKQTLKIYAIDTGVLLDYMMLNTKESKFPYHLGAETIISR
ncbi:glycosyl hydrolase 115 family protein [Wenyingzhuangia sp. chi5]|uniref:Glycosyl hydrolase 115 family protein n=1 Tax=Wenyingzhuangia gilva TaxID=3057677 RepID=A0ABT8VUE3_9FLAO|nr:glycosyl hydrolase 115 family protein [Wenyingzhuangia sp. chi5]MDO3695600.1 glycosyl hydrolase 115 family protein [Wenyingzhuangia sp. chi5]